MVNIVKLYNVNVGINEQEPIIKSQIIFSAILKALPEKADLLINDKNFTVSSMFPFSTIDCSEKKYVPIVSARILKDFNKKKFKKVNLIDSEILTDKEKLERINEEDIEKITFDKENFKYKQTHNRVPRNNNEETKLYFSFRLKTTNDSGLWFAYTKEYRKEIEKALNEIKVYGLGRDKSTSAEPFETFEFDEIKDSGDWFINLGLYSPTKNELESFLQKSNTENKKPKYELENYSGWTEVIEKNKIINKEKPAKYYYKEGSIFPSLEKQVYGRREKYNKINSTNLNTKIFWNGITIPFYFNWQGEQ
ncbi:MAG: hypothetical protein QXT97_04190 [Candidatus Diapherotrites archaeon]